MKNELITRRAVCAGGILSAGCKTAAGNYFGRNDPPSEQRLVYIIGGEPATLDPGRTSGGWECYIVPALFEGLTNYHPRTGEPMAALATHYHANDDRTRLTFCLRGHSRPEGIKLPNTDSLRNEFAAGKLNVDFSRGHSAPEDRIPARWSDGTPITAEDFVYSWCRVIDPQTATPQFGYYLYHVKNGREISAGKLDPRTLGVRALDEFTFEVELRAPTPFFMRLLAHRILAPVPRSAVEAASRRGEVSSWTEPSQIVTSGAFTLREHRPKDKIVLLRNPCYYEPGLVALQDITFLSVVSGNTSASLYKAGNAHSMDGSRLPPLLAKAVERKHDACVLPAFSQVTISINAGKWPLDKVFVRYALNMAIDKDQIAGVFGAGRIGARSFVPPVPAYEGPGSMTVSTAGKTYDVLAHNPAGARELLADAGFPNGEDARGGRLSFDYVFPTFPHSRPIAEILQQQWRRNLNIEVRLVTKDEQSWRQSLFKKDYGGMAESGGTCDYLDPNAFLGDFLTGAPRSALWCDPQYDTMLLEANATTDPAKRMRRLSECEAYLLRAMPLIPLLFHGFAYLQKPYVRGLDPNPLDIHPFKYAWIDTHWKSESL